MSDGDLRGFFGDAFDPATVEPSEDYVALLPGKYPVIIDSAEVKETKAGNGHYIKVALSVLEGPSKNRKLWDNINIDNPSEKCVEIGMRQLSAICQAVGLTAIRDTAELSGKTCIAHVKVDGDGNSIRTYSSVATHQAEGQPVQQQPQPIQQQPAPVQQQPVQQEQPDKVVAACEALMPQPVQQQPAPGTPQPAAKVPWAR